MFYAILTEAGRGMPFNYAETPPTAPGDPLRISENATLVAFENQPDLVFASKCACVSGKILWHVTENILHRDDLPAAETFSNYREFQNWLILRDME